MADRRVRARLQVARPDGATLVDLTDHLVRAKVNLGDVSAIGTGASGVDVVVRQLEIELANERNEPTGLMPFSFSRASAPLNFPRFVDVPGWGKGLRVEEGTTNLIPSAKQTFIGWTAYQAAMVTLNQGIAVPEWSAVDATRIQVTGGTSALKYYLDLGLSAAGVEYGNSVWIKNNGSTAVTFRGPGSTYAYNSFNIAPGQSVRAFFRFTGDGVYRIQIRFQVPTAADQMDIIVWRPQVETKPYATSWIDGTRSPESLSSQSTGLSLIEGFHVDVRPFINDLTVRKISGQYPMMLHISGSSGGSILLCHSASQNQWSFECRNDAGTYSGAYVSDSLTPVGSIAHFRLNVQAADPDKPETVPYAGVWGWKADGTWGELARITNPLLPSGLGTISWLSQSGTSSFLNTDLCEARTGRGMDFNPPPKSGGMGPNQATTAFSNFNGYINYAGTATLHPRDRASSWNLFDGSYQPLLWPYRQIFLDVATCPIEREPLPSEWVRLFSGYMGDEISGVSDTGRITVLCRDPAFLLQSKYILDVQEYGSMAGVPAETVIQQIIDNNLGAGFETLCCPTSPGFMLKPYKVEYQTAWDAMQAIATQIGWFLGYRWDSAVGDFRLIFMEPPRHKDGTNPDFVLDWDENLRVQQLKISVSSVRNVVKVNAKGENGKRISVTVEDAASIEAFGGGLLGRREMEIEEASTSLINTIEELTRLANAALADLKDLTASSSIALQLTPDLDIFAGVNVVNPLLSSTNDFYAVETVVHSLDWSGENSFKASTEIVCSGRVIGGHGKWLRMQTRPGAWGQPNVPADTVTHTSPNVPTGLTVTSVIKGLSVSLDEPANDPYWDGFEIHVAATPGFTPKPTTLKAKGRAKQFTIADLIAGATCYVKALAYNSSGAVSEACAAVSGVAGLVGSGEVGMDVIDSGNIKNGAIITDKLDTGAVTTEKVTPGIGLSQPSVFDGNGQPAISAGDVRRLGPGGLPVEMFLPRTQRMWAASYVQSGCGLFNGKIGLFPATESAYVDSTQPSVNFGSQVSPIAWVQWKTGDVKLAYIKAPFALPAGVSIYKAYLRIYTPSVAEVIGWSGILNVFNCGANWAQDALNYNNRPVNGVYTGTGSLRPEPGWVDIDVTDIVSEIASGAIQNYGFVIDSTFGTVARLAGVSFSSAEYRPQLVIEYRDPAALNVVTPRQGEVIINNRFINYPLSSQGFLTYTIPNDSLWKYHYFSVNPLTGLLTLAASDGAVANAELAGLGATKWSNGVFSSDTSLATGKKTGAYDIDRLLGNRVKYFGWRTITANTILPLAHNLNSECLHIVGFIKANDGSGIIVPLQTWYQGGYEYGPQVQRIDGDPNNVQVVVGANYAMLYFDPTTRQRVELASASMQLWIFRLD